MTFFRFFQYVLPTSELQKGQEIRAYLCALSTNNHGMDFIHNPVQDTVLGYKL